MANKLNIFLSLLLVLCITQTQLTKVDLSKQVAANESYKIVNTMLKTEIENLKEIQGHYVPMIVKATGYAPLDPRAIEGMCYSGDPRITASRAPSDPSRSVAMGPSIPFGTQVYIPGIGFRVVEDRGGSIKDDCIDIMFHTREQAFTFGVQEDFVIFVKVKE